MSNPAPLDETSALAATTALERTRAPARGWVVLLLTWFAFLMENVCRGAWGAVANDAQRSFGLGLAALGAFTSASVLGYVIVNIPGGVLADRVGGHRVVPWAVLVMAVATGLFSTTTNFLMGLTMQFVAGLGIGFAFASSVSLLASWFPPAQRGIALGLYMTGNSVGIVAVNATTPVIEAALGWQSAYLAYGIVSGAVALACFIVLRPGPIDTDRETQTMGEVIRETLSLFRSPAMLIVLLGAIGVPWAAQGFANWAKLLIIRGDGLSAGFAALVVVVFGMAAIPAKPIFGAISDHLGARRTRPLVLIALLFGVLLLGYGQLKSPTALLLGAGLLGLVAFIPGQLLVTMVTEMVSRRVVGVASGLANTFAQFGAFLVPIVVGSVFQASHRSIAWSFVALAAGPLFTACVYAFLKEQTLDEKNRTVAGAVP